MSRNGKNNKGGRPKGSRNASTLERDRVNALVRTRILRAANRLTTAQIALGIGSQYLFRIDKTFVRTGQSRTGEPRGYYRNEKPVQVTEPTEMQSFLEGHVRDGDKDDDQDPAASYYFLTSKDPENSAIVSALDRGIGKVKEEIGHSVSVTFSLLALATQAEEREKLGNVGIIRLENPI